MIYKMFLLSNLILKEFLSRADRVCFCGIPRGGACGGQPTVLCVLVTHNIGHQIVTALTGSGCWTRQGCDVDGGLKISREWKMYRIKTFQTLEFFSQTGLDL